MRGIMEVAQVKFSIASFNTGTVNLLSTFKVLMGSGGNFTGVKAAGA
jgi:hypothetical protein